MATAATENAVLTRTLSGFSQELNWRPTEFISAIPQIRCCSLCGVIPNETRVLPCSHVFCKVCYDRVANSNFVCPQDNKPFNESQAKTIEFSQLQLLTREVRCWNSTNGCKFVGRVLDVLAHFHEACDFHKVNCPRCNSMVIQRDILDHRNRLCGVARATQQRNQPSTVSSLTSTNSTLNDILQKTELIAVLINRLADNQASLQDSINNFTATNRDGLRNVTASISNQANEIAHLREKQETFNLVSKTAVTNMEASLKDLPSMLRHQCRLRNVAPETFHLSTDKVCWPVEDIMRYVQDERKVKIIGEPFMLGGYRVRLTVKFDRSEPDMEICTYFSMRPGPNDDVLDWPFIIPVKMSLVHPRDRTKEKRRMIDPVASRYPEIFQRPTEDVDHGEGGCLVKMSEMEEYVTEGSLLICAELIRDRDAYSAQFVENVVHALAEMLSQA